MQTQQLLQYLEVANKILFATDSDVWRFTHVVTAVKPANQLASFTNTEHCWWNTINCNDMSCTAKQCQHTFKTHKSQKHPTYLTLLLTLLFFCLISLNAVIWCYMPNSCEVKNSKNSYSWWPWQSTDISYVCNSFYFSAIIMCETYKLTNATFTTMEIWLLEGK